jgi:hypothetical protein
MWFGLGEGVRLIGEEKLLLLFLVFPCSLIQKIGEETEAMRQCWVIVSIQRGRCRAWWRDELDDVRACRTRRDGILRNNRSLPKVCRRSGGVRALHVPVCDAVRAPLWYSPVDEGLTR